MNSSVVNSRQWNRSCEMMLDFDFFILFVLMQSSVFHVIASLAGKNGHFSVSLFFACVCQVKSAGFGFVSSISATDL